jgi:hypothetical protein
LEYNKREQRYDRVARSKGLKESGLMFKRSEMVLKISW